MYQKCCQISCFLHASDSHIRFPSSNTGKQFSLGYISFLCHFKEWRSMTRNAIYRNCFSLIRLMINQAWTQILQLLWDRLSEVVKHINTEEDSHRIAQVRFLGNSHKVSSCTFMCLNIFTSGVKLQKAEITMLLIPNRKQKPMVLGVTQTSKVTGVEKKKGEKITFGNAVNQRYVWIHMYKEKIYWAQR